MNNSDSNSSTNLYDIQSRIADAKKFLDLLFGAVSGKRYSYLWLKNPTQKGGGVTTAYCVTDDATRERMAADAIRICDNQGLEVYVGVNCTDEPSPKNVRSTTPTNKKPDDKKNTPVVTVQTATVTDIDAVGGAHVNHVDEKTGKNIVYLPDFDTAKSLIPFQLSMLINSGYGGLHGYALYREPIVITADNDKLAEERNKKFIDMIQHRAGVYIHAVDSIHDLPRVLRVVGTRNYKGGVTDDAPFVRFGEINDVRFSPEELDEKIATFMPAPSPTIFTPTPSATRKKKSDAQAPKDFSYRPKNVSAEIEKLRADINAQVTPEMLIAHGYLRPSPDGAADKYCCEWCGSPHSDDGSAACHYYSEGGNSHFTCFSKAVYNYDHGGDVFALIVQHKQIDCHGANYFKALREIADEFTVEYDEKIFKTTRKTTEQIIEGAPVNLVFPADVTFYGNEIQLVSWKFDKQSREKVPSYFTVARTIILPSKKFCDLSSGKISYEVSIHLPNGKWKRVDVDGQALYHPIKIIELTDYGADVASPKGLKDFFSKVLTLPENDERIPKVKVYNRPGWCGNLFVYPTPDETDNYIVRRNGINYSAIFTVKGDAAEWLKKFREIIPGRQGQLKRIVIGACALAPMLKVIGIPNPQFNLWGQSNLAKTPLVKFGLSIYGDPSEGKMLRTWGGSSKNRLTMAAGFNSLPQMLDEGESMSANSRKELSAAIYDFATGLIKQINKRNGDVNEAEKFDSVRFSTAETPMHTDSDKRGAYKRLIDLHVSEELFSDDYARALHLFLAENHGHYGRQWCKYIVTNKGTIKKDFEMLYEWFSDKGFDRDRRHADFSSVDATNARSIIACSVAYRHFYKFIGLDTDFDYDAARDDAERILAQLPTVEDISDVKRSINLLASWIHENPTRFITPQTHQDGSPIDGMDNPATSFAGTVGKKFANGDVAFYQNAFRKICEDIRLPSYEKFLSDLYELGALDCKSSRTKVKQIRIGKDRPWVYYIKADVFNPKKNDD